ncbi:kinase-like protein [Ceraceosorus bombacis]|uniref:non-specific serine/threonine protein kinase n=1 Tax=Ceraceosorus bombacis TaxID=401625 RepID=A0A0P1BQI4_9BASI|nr:kinase-like protein [Ceraceosorus bombacis]
MPAVTSPPATISSHGSSGKKFSTITGQGQYSNRSNTSGAGGLGSRQSVKGLFDLGNGSKAGSNLTASKSAAATAAASGVGPAAAAAISREDGIWSVSVAEARDKRQEPVTSKRSSRQGPPKPSIPAYTLYITNPTHNLTLLRNVVEIGDLDAKLREAIPTSGSSKTLPALPALPTVAQNSTSASQPNSRRILQTISRTLSPGANRNRERSALSNLTGIASPKGENGAAQLAPVTPTKSGSPADEKGQGMLGATTPTSPVNIPSTPVEKASDAHNITTKLATYFTTISNIPAVRKHKAWRRFVRVGSDDFESVRVERRVRKVRSDLAEHVKATVAPTNTNVGLAAPHGRPSVGDDGGRTEDEADSQSASDHARDVGRKPSSFANIPEEHEKPDSVHASSSSKTQRTKNASAQQKGQAENSKSSNNALSAPAGKDTKPERKHRRVRSEHKDKDKVTVDDFEMIRVLGKGCAGKVLLARHKASDGLFAMKSIHKRHVLAHQELQHTLTEQAVLKRMANDVIDPFVVKLWWSFHDKNNLYLVMDFHPGGDLATQLSRWGRLGRDRARFYAAEIVEGVEGLHRAGVIYRDLKPENVLIGADGHIVLSDFGLSKEFPVHGEDGARAGSSTPPPGSPKRSHSSAQISGGKAHQPHWMSASDDGAATASDAFASRGSKARWADDRDTTTTFCGTAEYLAPEVIQGGAYSYEVDWWSFGTMLFEMLTGITPFWAETHADMYVRVLHDELKFPDDRVLDQDTKSVLRGLLQRNPILRMKEPRIKKHPYFAMIEWQHVFHKRYIPPYIPPIDPDNEADTQNFDETFLDMQPVVNGADDDPVEEGSMSNQAAITGDASDDRPPAASAGVGDVGADKSGVVVKTTGADEKSLFDGYSFRGRRDSEAISSILSSGPSEDLEENAVVESEDDETAARNAVAALAHLESEASGDGSTSNASTSTQPTSIAYSRERAANATGGTGSSEGHDSVTHSNKSRTALSASGVPAHGTINETDDEDEDWDMVDTPSGQKLESEINGGKGNNLFSRGVVDTYRMLRRQESSKLPTSASSGSRAFNRLSRKQASSRRNLGSTSNGNFNSTSAVSLESSAARSGNETGGAVSGDDAASEREAADLSNSAADNSDTRNRKAGASPSVASSDEQLQERNRQRMKKIKRFTTFFEVAR